MNEFEKWMEEQSPVTGRQMCEEILAAIKDGHYILRNKNTGEVPQTAEQIWNYSPRGELYGVYCWYRDVMFSKSIRTVVDK